MFGMRIWNNSSAELLKILEDEMIINQQVERNEIWKETRNQIEKAQKAEKLKGDIMVISYNRQKVSQKVRGTIWSHAG